MELALELQAHHGFALIEDAAHCIGAQYRNKPLGTFGDFGALSFHFTKNIHCGEGGALLIRNANDYKNCLSILEKGTNKQAFESGEVSRYNWQRLGSSYGLSNLNAAMLSAQLKEVDAVNNRRREIWDKYHECLVELHDHLILPQVPDGVKHNGHIYFIRCKSPEIRDDLRFYLLQNGVQAFFHYPALHLSKAGIRYGTAPFKTKHAQIESERLLRLPIYPELTSANQTKVISLIFDFFNKQYAERD